MFTTNQSKFCTLKVYHGGEFLDYPGREYVNGKITYVDDVNTEGLNFDVLDQIMKCLSVDSDLAHLCDQASKGYKLIDLYVELGHSNVMIKLVAATVLTKPV
ncbi:hypothetical protein Hanom_Chr06g00541241 [Helianthus anomalus]